MTGKLRTRLIEFVLIGGSLLIGLALVEISYRAWIFWTYAVETNYPVVIVDTDTRNRGWGEHGSIYGPYPVSATVQHSLYLPSGKRASTHAVRSNNFGWISQHDYSRTKPEGEYRIAIIGDSLTASINNEKPWPDALQKILNADDGFKTMVGAKNIVVLNLGVAGASMQMMANPLSLVAKRFSADLVVTNFVIEDLARRHDLSFEIVRAEPAVIDDTPRPRKPRQDEFTVNGVLVSLLCGPASCAPNSFWQAEPGRTFTPDEINAIKRTMARRILWRGPLSSARMLSFEAVLGLPLFPPI